MALRRGESAVCIILCVVIVSANSNYFNKDLLLGKKHLIISEESLKNTTFLYGLCDFSDSVKPNGSCEVILETFNFDETSKKFSCEVPLKTRVTGDVNLAHVGKRKAVLVALADSLNHAERQQLHLINLDLESCKIIYKKVAAPPSEKKWNSKEVFAVPYENTYDVIFCHTDRFVEINWKGTYDLEGNVVKQITPWADHELTQNSIQLINTKYQSPDGGFITLRSGSDKVIATYINDNGKKILREWNVSSSPYGTLLFFDNNETTSACIYIYKNSNVKCVIFGPQGVEKAEVTLDVVPYYFADVLDGYIVVHGKCIDLKKSSTDVELPCKDSKVYIRRLNRDGQLVKELPLSTFDLDPDVGRYNVQVFKNEAGETCISYINFSNNHFSYLLGFPNKLQVAAQCFADL